MARHLKRAAAVILISLVSLEVMSIISVHSRLVPANAPSYVWPSFTPFWDDTNPDFGMWHPADGHFNHIKACYNLVYRTNSYGARDRERPRKSDRPRAVVLGDSFVEGYGLARDDRVTDRLETAAGTPHLNFGTSGGFGLTQSYLLYKTLAAQFSHDRVMVFILPDNDFEDDDPAAAERRGDSRFAPYFIDGPNGFTLHYRNASADDDGKAARRARNHALKSILRSFTYAANVLDYLKAAITYQSAIHPKAVPNERGYSGYHDFTPEQWRRFEHILTLLFAETGSRPVTLVIIPRPNDIARTRPGTGTPFMNGLKRLVASHPTVRLIDLLPAFEAHSETETLFNRCDGHWSPAGAALAAEVISGRR